MEGTTNRTLIQEKAILVARQGDPKNPASGTLLHRQRILNAELQTATGRDEPVLLSPSSNGMPYQLRHPDQIRRDIYRIENELRKVQDRLREIDMKLADGGNKSAC